MGYSHSYLDPENTCIESLATYPTDGEISLAVGEASDEAVTLLGLLGIQAEDIPTQLTTDLSPPAPDDSEPESVERAGKETEAATLQHLIVVQQTPRWSAADSDTQHSMHMLTCAAISLEIEERRSL